MDFGPEGTANTLQYFTRYLVGDPASAASEQWAVADVKAAINRAYLDLRDIARSHGFGATTKRSYADAVASQIYYQRPADLVRLNSVEVSNNGSDLSTATVSAAEILYCEPWPAEKALRAYNSENLTNVAERCFLQDDHIGVVAPPTSTQAGTKTIRILYEASTTELSADVDVPEIFPPFHDLICYRAAITLKVARDMEFRELAAVAQEKEFRFRMACQDAMSMDEDVMAAQGIRQQTTPIVAGTTHRTYRRSADNDRY